MYADCHIHTRQGKTDVKTFLSKLNRAGIDKALIISREPYGFFAGLSKVRSNTRRLDDLISFTQKHSNLFPFYWIDPLSSKPKLQIKKAVDAGVLGFKIICNSYYPYDKRAMNVFNSIAEVGKPILFHSGILWDGHDSSKYCRPVFFESLIAIKNLKFSLAHVSWPWFDECIAVYGKFLNSYLYGPDRSAEMFIDLTPGTPPIYRRRVLETLFTIGYDAAHNVMFGTDGCCDDYNDAWAREWIKRDNKVYESLGLSRRIQNNIYSNNLLRFIGMAKTPIQKKALKPGE